MIYIVYDIDIFKQQAEFIYHFLKNKYTEIKLIKLTSKTKYDNNSLYIGFFNRICRYPKHYAIYNAEDLRNKNINKNYHIQQYIDNCTFHIDFSKNNIEYIIDCYPKHSDKLFYIPFGYTDAYDINTKTETLRQKR